MSLIATVAGCSAITIWLNILLLRRQYPKVYRLYLVTAVLFFISAVLTGSIINLLCSVASIFFYFRDGGDDDFKKGKKKVMEKVEELSNGRLGVSHA
jgi:hypothetical protein